MPDVLHFSPDEVLDSVVELFWRQGVAGTGIQDVVAATGVNRSSLYATFGSKDGLYLAALRHYLDRRSRVLLERLASGRGLPAVADFFAAVIRIRCTGPYARWGCMIANAVPVDLEVNTVLQDHHDLLHGALVAALSHADLRMSASEAADVLVLLTYGISVRSRAGATQKSLQASVSAALNAIAV